MLKWVKVLIVGVAAFSSSCASAWDVRSSGRLDIGYRRDSIDWKFKSPFPNNECFKNRFSSHFDDLHIIEVGLYGDATFCNCLYGRAQANIGWILDGHLRENLSNIQSVERNTVFQREISVRNALDGKYTSDLLLAVGSPFNCWCSFITATPLIGYSYKSQYIIVDRNQRIFREDELEPLVPPNGELAQANRSLGLYVNECHDDKWITRWWGPFIGIDFYYDSCQCWDLFLKLEGHFPYFKAKKQGVTQLNPEFDNFDESSRHAHGYVIRFGGDYDFCRCWFVGFEGYFQRFVGHKSKEVCLRSQRDGMSLGSSRKFSLNAKLFSFALKLTVGSNF